MAKDPKNLKPTVIARRTDPRSDLKNQSPKRVKAKPFLKWAGGKGQLLGQILAAFPRGIVDWRGATYIEPFSGSAAVLFRVLELYQRQFSRIIINDVNADLMDVYRTIRDSSDDLIEILFDLQDAYYKCDGEEARRAMFLKVRDEYNRHQFHSRVGMAASFIFLNRTSFNGLYRVNSNGLYNVPFGKAVRPKICNSKLIKRDSELLGLIEPGDIRTGDYRSAFDGVSKKSNVLCYFDPPYKPLSKTASFTSYSKTGFGDTEQRELAEYCRGLNRQGCKMLISNSDLESLSPPDYFFRRIFPEEEGFVIQTVTTTRTINACAKRRGKLTEILIRNFVDMLEGDGEI